jgi:acetylornithine deacetylase/succinyl-diaminopimelate desuccinylase-like protein
MTDAELTPPATTEADLRAAVEQGLPAAIADLCALVRIPSVSWAAFDPAQVESSAEEVARIAFTLGVFDSVEVKQAGIPGTGGLGQPAVLATRAARNGRPTIMLYAHHDVQPPGNDDDWESPPFEPTVRGDRLYGRGAADDKAGVMVHIAAIRALVEAAGAEFDLGLALFIEGEEEFGSRSFATFLAENRDALTADVIVVADSDNRDTTTPALTTSLRGNVTFRLTVRSLSHASHSGAFGGAVPDAMLATIRLLATLHAEDGSVAVAGLENHEQAFPEYSEDLLREEAGLLPGVTPIGHGPILGRMWSQPAITVTGIDAPSVANASNTLSPAVSVRISARIAPGQSARDAYVALERHLREHAPFGAHIDLEAQILVTGVEDPDTRAHSPNESLHLGVFKRAVMAEALLLSRLNDRAER